MSEALSCSGHSGGWIPCGRLIVFCAKRYRENNRIRIDPRKRNGRKQELHLKMARSNRDILQADKGTRWDDHDGRKPKKEIVLEWRKDHPEGKKADCVRDTRLDKKTVYKWWNNN